MKERKLLVKYSEVSEKITCWIEGHAITRWFVTYANLAFFYGIFLALYELAFLREIVPTYHLIFIAWAGILIIYDVFVRKSWKNLTYWKILLVFMVLAAVTAVVNVEAGLTGNVKVWILVVLPLFVFYPVCFADEKKKRVKYLIRSMTGLAGVFFGASLVAIGLFFTNVSQTISYMETNTVIGYRYYLNNDPSSGLLLYGIYKDTNHAAIYAIVITLFSAFLFLHCKKGFYEKKWKNSLGMIFAIANIIVQICYFPFANSRGGWLSLILALVVVVFLYCNFSKINVQKKATRVLVSCGIAVITAVVIYGGLVGIRTSLVHLESAPQRISSMIAENAVSDTPEPIPSDESEQVPSEGVERVPSEETEQLPSEETERLPSEETEQLPSEETEQLPSEETEQLPSEETEQLPSDTVFEKKDTSAGAGRLSIWKEAIELFTEKPILGTGPGNNMYYANKYETATYLSANKAVHNSYLDLLLDYGVLGFVAMMLFCLLCVKTVVVTMVKKKKDVRIDYYLIGMIVLIVAMSSFFLSNIFINTTAMYFVLLVPLGYLMADSKYH